MVMSRQEKTMTDPWVSVKSGMMLLSEIQSAQSEDT